MRYAILSMLLLTLLLASCAAVTVAPGDTVSVTYTGRLQNGSVFDSNDPARQADIPQKTAFAPMTVTVGQGRLIPGFEQALIGMREGETKTVTIPAKDAYGPYRAELVRIIPRTVTYPREVEIRREIEIPAAELEARLAKPIAPLQLFETENFQYAISAVDSGTATLYLLAPRNETVQLEGYPWPSTMVRQTNQTMTFRHDALDKSLVQTLDGPYVAHVNATHIRLETALQPDQEFGSSLGDGRVTRGTDSTLTLDLNHPLAGKDLTFEIRVDAIERRE